MQILFKSSENKFHRVLRHVIYWTFVLAFFTIMPSFYQHSIKEVFFYNLLYQPIDILATYFVLYILFPKYLRNKVLFFLFGLVLTYIVVILVSMFIRYYIEPILGIKQEELPLMWQAQYSILIISSMIAPALFIKYNIHYNKLKDKKLDLEKQNYQSKIKLLKSQINPHFLFNTLNNIDELIYQNHEKASDAIVLLSENMRYMLNNTLLEKINLSKELDFVFDYIKLAKLSFVNNDFIRFHLKGHTGGLMIEPLLLLPLIENAIKHSNKNVTSPGISIKIEIVENTLELTTNNYLQIARNNKKNKGFGLSNLKNRLELLYFNNFEFSTIETENQFKAYLKINLS